MLEKLNEKIRTTNWSGFRFEDLDDVQEWSKREIPVIEEPEEVVEELGEEAMNRLVRQHNRILRQMWEREKIAAANRIVNSFPEIILSSAFSSILSK